MSQNLTGDQHQRILVIKLGALGDMVQALGPMAAIRQHHPNAKITVLTTKPYEPLLKASGYVDDIWLDPKPRWHQISAWLGLRKRLNAANFDRVYDLQTSDRSSGYYRLFKTKPEWSGIARGCSHPHSNPNRDDMHTIERQAEQLKCAGISDAPLPDLSWANSDVSAFNITAPYVLFVPGGAPHRPQKRWLLENFSTLADNLIERGITPILLGTQAEAPLLSQIKDKCPTAINLCGKTDMIDLATLGKGAAAAVGNDTGPMHLIAVTGCPTLSLFSHDSNPALCAQRGPKVEILREENLSDLTCDKVEQSLSILLAR